MSGVAAEERRILATYYKERGIGMSIVVSGTGDLAGFHVLPISRPLFIKYVNAANAMHIAYGMGHKDARPGAYPPHYTSIDCSGFFRTLLDYSTFGATSVMPDGSSNEADWLRGLGLKRHAITSAADYAAAVNNADIHIRACFHHPGGNGDDPTGHVWCVFKNGSGEVVTAESHGGVGVSSRPWNTPVLEAICDEVFVLI